jgi:hypothetical protein
MMDVDVLVDPWDPASVKEPYYDEMDKFCDESNKVAPDGMKNMR